MGYRGPKARLMRRFGEIFTHSPKYERILERRPNPPGQHGAQRRRVRMSEYARRLFEKQKLKAIYNVSERQLLRYMAEASRRPGPTGTNLLQILERRLDQVVYRLGFAPTIWSARQLVNHGHVRVNGRKTDIPSYLVDPGDTITLSEKMQQNPRVVEWLAARPSDLIPPYLRLDREAMTGEFLRVPNREEIAANINEALIIEFYARR
ncbi:MAG: 30S ribosomal protein S4 [Herpetosiphonaceae bacterium]|nr:MAG: 30S ribosomal protein S4 [Herpetosiphonaceae bacterium]